MTTLADVLGAPLHQDSGDLADTPGAYEATVTAVDGDTVSVLVPGYSTRHDFQGLPYLAPAGAPVVDDAAFVVFSDDRDPLVLVPGTGSGVGPTGPAGPAGSVSWATVAKLGVD